MIGFSDTTKLVKMPDYSKAKIYCIKSSQTDKVYYGSTCQSLNQRFKCHKTSVNITSKELTQYQDAYIELVEEFPCNSRAELSVRERYYVENNPCVNKNIPGRTVEEWCEVNEDRVKDCNQQWYQANKDRILESRKEYYLINKAKIKEYQRLRYLALSEK